MGRDAFRGREFPSARVDRVMRRYFIAVAPEDTLLDAFQLMRLARLRSLPVVSDGVLLGVLSFRAVLAASLARLAAGEVPVAFEGTRVRELATPAPCTLEAEAELVSAAAALCRHDTGSLPIVEPGASGPRMVGLVTESDLLRAAYEV